MDVQKLKLVIHVIFDMIISHATSFRLCFTKFYESLKHTFNIIRRHYSVMFNYCTIYFKHRERSKFSPNQRSKIKQFIVLTGTFNILFVCLFVCLFVSVYVYTV